MQLGILVTFVGLTVVFLALIILSYIIELFSKIFSINRKNNSDNTQNNKTSVQEEIVEEVSNLTKYSYSDEELIAVLTAAIQAAMGQSTDRKIKVKSFKRIPQTSPVWNSVGRSEYIAGKL